MSGWIVALIIIFALGMILSNIMLLKKTNKRPMKSLPKENIYKDNTGDN